jgi:hypothetical protein
VEDEDEIEDGYGEPIEDDPYEGVNVEGQSATKLSRISNLTRNTSPINLPV